MKTPTCYVNVHEPTSGGILYRIVEVGERKQIIGKFFNKEKAERFVHAVNSHAAYERIIRALQHWTDVGEMPRYSSLMPDSDTETFGQAIDKVKP